MKTIAAILVLAAGIACGETVEQFRARMAANPPPANAKAIPQQGRGLKKNQPWYQVEQDEQRLQRTIQQQAEYTRRMAEYQRQQLLIQQQRLQIEQQRQMQAELNRSRADVRRSMK